MQRLHKRIEAVLVTIAAIAQCLSLFYGGANVETGLAAQNSIKNFCPAQARPLSSIVNFDFDFLDVNVIRSAVSLPPFPPFP